MTEVVELGDVRIGFRNFEGREGAYNRKGERSFAVFLPQDIAEQMAADGWNVKFPEVHEDDEFAREPYMNVSLTFDKFPPKVVLFSNGVATKLSGDEVSMLDWAEIVKTDLVIRPYEWSVNKAHGVKAYLKAGYFTIETDSFASKYGI